MKTGRAENEYRILMVHYPKLIDFLVIIMVTFSFDRIFAHVKKNLIFIFF